MSDLIDTTEMYLRTIYELEEEGLNPLRARIAERIGHSGPTVSQTVARMERDGLVVVEEDRHLALTPQGRALAMRVMRKHRLAERLLTDVIGLSWPQVHDEACRWEHVMSDEVERRLVEILDHPADSPYGNPIPGLEELADGGELGELDPAGEFMSGVIRLSDALAAGRGGEFLVMRLGENLQTDIEQMEQLHAAGLRPGATIAVAGAAGSAADAKDGTVEVSTAGGSVKLPEETAKHIFVAD